MTDLHHYQLRYVCTHALSALHGYALLQPQLVLSKNFEQQRMTDGVDANAVKRLIRLIRYKELTSKHDRVCVRAWLLAQPIGDTNAYQPVCRG